MLRPLIPALAALVLSACGGESGSKAEIRSGGGAATPITGVDPTVVAPSGSGSFPGVVVTQSSLRTARTEEATEEEDLPLRRQKKFRTKLRLD